MAGASQPWRSGRYDVTRPFGIPTLPDMRQGWGAADLYKEELGHALHLTKLPPGRERAC